MSEQPDFESMTKEERESRVRSLVQESKQILKDAIAEHQGDREIVAKCVLFSGGNDSTTLAHIFKDECDYAIHCNTTIGIEQTREFVRNTCRDWGLPLMEEVAPVSYRDLVIDQGFPGPGHHFKMYQRLKERGLLSARRKMVSNPYKERVVYIAGRRRAESKRREGIPVSERRGSIIYVSPLINWHKMDLVTYRSMMGDVPRNEVSDILHMSGECLCGAFAKKGELDEIRMWFPDVAKEIDDIQEQVKAAGHTEPKCVWGNGGKKSAKPSRSGLLCSSCDERFIEDAQ